MEEVSDVSKSLSVSYDIGRVEQDLPKAMQISHLSVM